MNGIKIINLKIEQKKSCRVIKPVLVLNFGAAAKWLQNDRRDKINNADIKRRY
jgi:hypothetical protein